MIRFFVLMWLVFGACAGFSQAEVIRPKEVLQTDSLIDVARTLTQNRSYTAALQALEAAEALTNPGTVAYAAVRFNKGRTLYFSGDYAASESFYLESMRLREQLLGKMHLDYAWCLNNLGVLYLSMGRHQEAETMHKEAKDIREVLLGRHDPAYTQSLNNLANVYSSMGDFSRAETMYLETLSILEVTKGKQSGEYANTLGNLGTQYNMASQYAKAEPLLRQSLDIQEQISGTENVGYAGGLINLANAAYHQGYFSSAEGYLLKAKDIFELKLGNTTHPYYLNCLNNLGNLYRDINRSGEAEALYLRVLDLKSGRLGKKNASFAESLLNLAILYKITGRFDQAESLYGEALSIYGAVNGPQHQDYARTLTSLGSFYSNTGQPEKAEQLYLQAKGLFEGTSGLATQTTYASILTNLANIYMRNKQFDQAFPLYQQALAVYEQTSGRKSQGYATCLNNMAILYKDIGDFENAERLYLETKSIHAETSGTESIDYADALNNLAALYSKMGRLDNAEPLLLQAKNIWERLQGKEHSFYIRGLNSLAALYERLKNYSKAEALFEETGALTTLRILRTVDFMSERELAYYTATFNYDANLPLSCLYRRHRAGQKAGILPGRGLEQSLFLKGFLLHSAMRLRLPGAYESPEIAAIHRDLLEQRRRIAAELSKPIAERTAMEVMMEEANLSEKKLARLAGAYALDMQQVSLNDLRQALKPGESALEFVRFSLNFPGASDSVMYAALLLHHGKTQPVFIPLFEEKQLDQLLESAKTGSDNFANQLYQFKQAGPKDATLTSLIWEPMRKHLKGTRTLYLSPVGLLHRINLGAIPINQRQALSDVYRISMRNSLRSLAVPHPRPTTNNQAVIIGGVRYDPDTTQGQQVGDPDTMQREREPEVGSAVLQRPVSRWRSLPWTLEEARTVADILRAAEVGVYVQSDTMASEQFVKTIGETSTAPRILHLATHGYFFPDPTLTIDSDDLHMERSAFQQSESPMIRSGLILAGANYAWSRGTSYPGNAEDGILTAYEIAQMNLAGTELVALSACETALGEIAGNEGVYGLQRAFRIAGARHILMSLWQVPDRQTAALMTAFYRFWQTDNMGVPEAFQAAQSAIRAQGLPPYYWAGFVLME
jgi:CHAT domain-containing protein/Flp pilus assembly protein TadD